MTTFHLPMSFIPQPNLSKKNSDTIDDENTLCTNKDEVLVDNNSTCELKTNCEIEQAPVNFEKTEFLDNDSQSSECDTSNLIISSHSSENLQSHASDDVSGIETSTQSDQPDELKDKSTSITSTDADSHEYNTQDKHSEKNTIIELEVDSNTEKITNAIENDIVKHENEDTLVEIDIDEEVKEDNKFKQFADKYTFKELRQMCKEKNLNTQGKKIELAERYLKNDISDDIIICSS